MSDATPSETSPAPSPAPETPAAKRSASLRALLLLGLVVVIYVVLTYGLIPLAWVGYADHHPALEEIPNITYTGDDHPGDPINLTLIGSERELKTCMLAAGWYPADPLTLKSCLEIAVGTVLSRPYDDAPVSSLYLWGRKEDLAFEQPVGNDPRKRHHVRFWKSDKLDAQGRPAWAGSVTYDKRVGLSHTTGQITHHIAADVDAEREYLKDNLEQAHELIDVHYEDNFHKIRHGINGGGDPWETDGRLLIGTLTIDKGNAE